MKPFCVYDMFSNSVGRAISTACIGMLRTKQPPIKQKHQQSAKANVVTVAKLTNGAHVGWSMLGFLHPSPPPSGYTACKGTRDRCLPRRRTERSPVLRGSARAWQGGSLLQVKRSPLCVTTLVPRRRRHRALCSCLPTRLQNLVLTDRPSLYPCCVCAGGGGRGKEARLILMRPKACSCTVQAVLLLVASWSFEL